LIWIKSFVRAETVLWSGSVAPFTEAFAMTPPRIFLFFPVSHFYRSGKATALGKVFSRFWAAWALLGLPPWRQVGLEVRGRKTGDPHTVAVVVARHDGGQYLVSMLGECEWVRNVRAALGQAWIVGFQRREVRLEEVPVEQRAPIIKDYIRLAPGARPHIGLDLRATLADCQRVAPNHPVFRIQES
jgi:deazaflavin-dependent oxidoreductase (nitroreductase family)